VQHAALVALVTSTVMTVEPVLLAVTRLAPDVQILVRTNYLRDLERLGSGPNIHYVVSEFETTIAVIERALAHKGVDQINIDSHLKSLRQEIGESFALN
jgi:hypothetical protein